MLSSRCTAAAAWWSAANISKTVYWYILPILLVPPLKQRRYRSPHHTVDNKPDASCKMGWGHRTLIKGGVKAGRATQCKSAMIVSQTVSSASNPWLIKAIKRNYWGDTKLSTAGGYSLNAQGKPKAACSVIWDAPRISQARDRIDDEKWVIILLKMNKDEETK